eukprot:6203779-Pleurochrysis_carterae.AAC.7
MMPAMEPAAHVTADLRPEDYWQSQLPAYSQLVFSTAPRFGLLSGSSRPHYHRALPHIPAQMAYASPGASSTGSDSRCSLAGEDATRTRLDSAKPLPEGLTLALNAHSWKLLDTLNRFQEAGLTHISLGMFADTIGRDFDFQLTDAELRSILQSVHSKRSDLGPQSSMQLRGQMLDMHAFVNQLFLKAPAVQTGAAP